jgi:hypothetical protein
MASLAKRCALMTTDQSKAMNKETQHNGWCRRHLGRCWIQAKSIEALACAILISIFTPPSIAADQSKLCDVAVCFKNKTDMTNYEAQHQCTFDKCGYSATRVNEELARIDRQDPTYGFYRNQSCIATKSCSQKHQLENKQWLDKVVYDFITPLAEEQGEWRAKKSKCKSLTLFAHVRCQRLMAEYHISVDLLGALKKNGCGTQKDWDRVGDWLKECVEAGIKDDEIVNPLELGSAYAFYVVKSERNRTRTECEEYRNSQKLKVEH